MGDWVRVAPTIFDTVFANDIRPDAKAAWVSYFGQRKDNANDIYHLDSIVDLVKRARAGEKVFPDDIDIVTGGFPCQDFSVAGKRLGFNSQKSHLGVALTGDEPSVESRGQLYMWMREVISLTSPKLFIAENVKGLDVYKRQVLDRMRENTTYVRNIKKYLLAALYNAPATIDSYYASLVNHDLYGSGERR